MSAITLLLGVHDHQPVGNFEEVMQSANKEAYRPFFETLEKHPSVKMTFHITGPLLEYLIEHDPDQIARLRHLAERGQVEFLTGGYYEPILPIIPEADQIGQIRKMTARIGEVFNARARGAWLAERVWEPQLPRPHGSGGGGIHRSR